MSQAALEQQWWDWEIRMPDSVAITLNKQWPKELSGVFRKHIDDGYRVESSYDHSKLEQVYSGTGECPIPSLPAIENQGTTVIEAQ